MDIESEAWPNGVRCRCCYREIFSGTKFRQEYIDELQTEACADVLQRTFSVNLTEMASEYACPECVGRLRDARDFKLLVLETEGKFLELLPGTSVSAAEDDKRIKTETPEQADEDSWEIDYLDTDDYIDNDSAIKQEKNSKESDAGVFKPADKKLKDILRKRKSDSVVSLAQLAIKKEKKSLDNIKIKIKKPTRKKLLSMSTTLTLKTGLKATSTAKMLPSARANKVKEELNVDTLLEVLANKPTIKVVRPIKKEEYVPTLGNWASSMERRVERQIIKNNSITLLKHTNIVPFIHYRSLFKCIFCAKPFLNFEQLKAHDDEEHSKRKNAVQKIHAYRDILHIEITDLKCLKCDASCADIHAAKSHLVNEHKVKLNMQHKDDVIEFKLLGVDGFQCHLCPQEFHVFRNLSVHMNEHFPNYMCESCGKPFISYTRCLSHESNHKTGMFPCKKCDKVFTTLNSRNSHSLEHRATKYRCPQCQETFKRYIDRTIHMSEVHQVTQRFVCTHPDCGKEFIHKPSFDAHSKSHVQKEKKVDCQVCGMKFLNNYCLRRHMISHTGERSFQCKVCGKKYGRRNTLREHMRIHENDRRHVCSECGQTFVQKCSLKGHIKSRHPHAAAC